MATMSQKILTTLVLLVFPTCVSLASPNTFIFNALDKRSRTLSSIFALNSSSAEAAHWLGADADTSIYLNQTTSLWLFGDTLFGGFDSKTNTRMCTSSGGIWNMSCGFAHSTLGILTQSSSLETNQRVAYDVEFFVNRTSDKAPVPFFSPPNTSSPNYWWVVSGVASYATQDIVLMAQVIAPAPAVCFGFAVEGTALISIDNVMDPLEQWKYSSMEVPGTGACTNWFVGMTHSDGKDSDEVYIVGTNGIASVDEHGCHVCSNSSVVLARANITDLRNLKWNDAVEFWCEDDSSDTSSSWFGASSSSGKWNSDCPNNKLRPLFTPTNCGSSNCPISEMSLFYNFYLGRWYTFVVRGFGPHIDFWFSESSDVTSSWDSQNVYTIEPPKSDLTVFMNYAAKAHPGLQLLSDELVFSFATNALNIDTLADEGMGSIYTPQLVSMQIAYASSLMIILLSAMLSVFVLAGATIAVVFVIRLRQNWTKNKLSDYAPLQ